MSLLPTHVAVRKISRMGLDPLVVQRLEGRRWSTAKDVLCRSEMELMEELNLMPEVLARSIEKISSYVCPKGCTVLEMFRERKGNQSRPSALMTQLGALDHALHGGIPFGAVTELVGPAGIGKTQFCLLLCIIANMSTEYGGLGGRILYIDTENKFSSQRLVEIAESRFPQVFAHNEEAIHHLTTEVLVISPTSATELVERLQGLEAAIIEHEIQLLVVDSVAALFRSEFGRDRIAMRQELLGRQASTLKYLAETFQIPVVVTNQVMGGSSAPDPGFSFAGGVEDAIRWNDKRKEGDRTGDQFLSAALGTKWAHCVNIRLILESHHGQRVLRIAKSPMSPVVSLSYIITAAGIVLDDDAYHATQGARGNMSIRNDGYMDFP